MIRPFVTALQDPLLRVAFVCILLMGPAVASVSPFQSVIGIERLGLSNAVYAFVVTTGSLFSVVASIAVGIVIDQTRSYQKILIICTLIGLLAGFVMGFAPSVASFLIVHLILFPIAATTFTQYFTLAAVAAERNPVLDKDVGLSVIRAGFAGTFAISPPLWGIALARGADLMSVYWVLAATSVIILIVLFSLWPKNEDIPADEKGSGLSFREAIKELVAGPILARLGLVTLVTSANGLYAILLGLMIVGRLGGQESDVGWFAGGVALVELPVMLGGSLLLKKYSRVQVILVGAIVYAFSLLALAVTPSMAMAWWLILPFGVGAGIILAIPVGYIQDLVAHRPGAGSALISMSHFGGLLTASAIFAAGSEFVGYSGVAALGAVIALCAGLVLFQLDRKQSV